MRAASAAGRGASAPRKTSPAPATFAIGRSAPQIQQHQAVNPPRIDTAAFRPGLGICTRLNSPLEADRIDREQWDAAHDWRRWAETIHPSPAQRWDIRVDHSASIAANAGMLHRLQAATRLREVAAAIGPLRVKILEAVVVHDRSWSELGRLLQVSDKTARERAAEAVTALADWRAGRSVPAPPAVRFRNQPGSW